jgi:hypothetical protein
VRQAQHRCAAGASGRIGSARDSLAAAHHDVTLVRAYDRLIECEPEPSNKDFLRRMRDSTSERMVNHVDEEGREYADRHCASMLEANHRGVSSSCDLGLRQEDLARIKAVLSRRTALPPTGDPQLDELLATLVSLRDRACACDDQACVEATTKDADAVSGSMVNATVETQDAAGKVIRGTIDCLQHPEWEW